MYNSAQIAFSSLLEQLCQESNLCKWPNNLSIIFGAGTVFPRSCPWKSRMTWFACSILVMKHSPLQAAVIRPGMLASSALCPLLPPLHYFLKRGEAPYHALHQLYSCVGIGPPVWFTGTVWMNKLTQSLAIKLEILDFRVWGYCSRSKMRNLLFTGFLTC